VRFFSLASSVCPKISVIEKIKVIVNIIIRIRSFILIRFARKITANPSIGLLKYGHLLYVSLAFHQIGIDYRFSNFTIIPINSPFKSS